MNGAADRRDRPRRDRARRRPRGAARRPRQQRRDPVPDRARRGRGAGLAGPGELVDPVLVAAAFARAADAAYESVREPGRGHDAQRRPRDGAPRGPGPRAHGHAAARPRRRRRASRTSCWPRCSSARSRPARRPSQRGPEQLAVLREAGVVDAGAYGLTVIVAGVHRRAARRRSRPSSRTSCPRARLHLPQHESSELPLLHQLRGHGRGARRPDRSCRARAARRLGAGRRRRARRCACTCTPTTPTRAVALFDGAGEVSRFDVADMREQVADRTRPPRGRGRRRAPRHGRAAAASWRWPAGAGLHALYRGARRARRRRRRDHEPLHLRAARRDPRRRRPRGARAAQQPERDPGGRARGRAVRAPGAGGAHPRPAGRARGAARLRPGRLEPRTPRRSAAAAEALQRRAAWRRPPATTPQGRFSEGDAVGYARRASWSPGASRATTLAATLGRVADGAELLTCLAGDGAPLGEGECEALLPDGLELDYHERRPAGLVVAARRRVASA